MKISDFSAFRGGRPALEQRWMEALGKGLQIQNFPITISAATGTFTHTPPGAPDDDYFIYCSVNNLTAVSFQISGSQTTAGANWYTINLPKETALRFRTVQVISSLGINASYFGAAGSSATTMTIIREDAGVHAIGNHVIFGTFFYFSKVTS